MIALQNPPILYKPAKPLVQFVHILLQVAVTDRHSPEAIELHTLSRNSGYCVHVGQWGGNERYLLNLEGLKLFRKAVRLSRKAALVDLAPISASAYESRVLYLLVSEYGETLKEASHFVSLHDSALAEGREEGMSAEIAARNLFDEIRDLYTCADCGCDTRVGNHQVQSGYYATGYHCDGLRREW